MEKLYVQSFKLLIMAKKYLTPVNFSEDVSVSCEGNSLKVKGKLGEMSLDVHPDVKILENKDSIGFNPSNNLPETRAITGTMRALATNLIRGVTEGFEKTLEINGVGYRAKLSGNKIELSLGFSHPIIYELPEVVSAELPSQTEIKLKSMNKQVLGEVASQIRGFRPPEPYKGKGVKYQDEKIRRKESKKA